MPGGLPAAAQAALITRVRLMGVRLAPRGLAHCLTIRRLSIAACRDDLLCHPPRPRFVCVRWCTPIWRIFLPCSGACYGRALRRLPRCLLADWPARPIALVLERDGQVCAYLAAYRSALGKVTPLHGDFEAVPQADTLYLHDMAVLPTCAGQETWRRRCSNRCGAMRRRKGCGTPRWCRCKGSQTYWERHGYAQQPLGDAAQRGRLASYGAGAVYMARAMAVAANTPPMG